MKEYVKQLTLLYIFYGKYQCDLRPIFYTYIYTNIDMCVCMYFSFYFLLNDQLRVQLNLSDKDNRIAYMVINSMLHEYKHDVYHEYHH